MSVFYDKANGIFNLQTPGTSYIIGIYEGKIPMHIYYGKKIEKTTDLMSMFGYEPFWTNISFAVDSREINGAMLGGLPQEYPTYGTGDYRTPLFHARYADGSTVTNLFYTGYRIYDGKEELDGLPSTYVEDGSEAQTLEIFLEDELTGVKVVLRYTAYNDRDVITRSNRIINGGKDDVRLQSVLSGAVELPECDYDFVHFSGSWARERHVEKNPLMRGNQYVDSLRGASSHMHNPFVCLASKGATETSGNVYAMNLVYSGNFISGAYVDTYDRTRFYTGINPFDFEWKLEPGESFQTPECVFVYSDGGFDKMSQTMHSLVRERVCRGKYRDVERPVLLNNWEATYFDFTEEKIVDIAKKAAEVGVELFVLDDGWFGERNDDKSSLGDWFANKEKLPSGIDGLAKKVNDLGLKFGLWFEPEMISEKSKLYEAHPDWCLHVEGRSCSMGRNQLILDYSRDDVCDYIIESLSKIFAEANIEYIKWDMNRNMSEIGSAVLPADRQRETAHRYMLGLYRVLATLKDRFPDLLMEGCSGGGGRFDLGMFCYFNQFWTSDDSDAVERQYIQDGTSYGYPTVVMGAHVSAVPNHQVKRVTDINLRGYVALSGQFGYELDLATLTDGEIAEVKKQIALCKEFAPVFHKGAMHRIKSPFSDNMTVWEFVSADGNTAILQIFGIKGQVGAPHKRICLRGLEAGALYKERFTGKLYTGEMLMNIGIFRNCCEDYTHEMMILEKVGM